MFTLPSLKMSQLKLIPRFSSPKKHTKSFHFFTFILFVKFMAQSFKIFHKATLLGLPARLLLFSRFPVSLSSAGGFPVRHGILFTVPLHWASNPISFQVFHRCEPFSENQGHRHYFQVFSWSPTYSCLWHWGVTLQPDAYSLTAVPHRDAVCGVAGGKVSALLLPKLALMSLPQSKAELVYFYHLFCSKGPSSHPQLKISSFVAFACFLPPLVIRNRGHFKCLWYTWHCIRIILRKKIPLENVNEFMDYIWREKMYKNEFDQKFWWIFSLEKKMEVPVWPHGTVWVTFMEHNCSFYPPSREHSFFKYLRLTNGAQAGTWGLEIVTVT